MAGEKAKKICPLMLAAAKISSAAALFLLIAASQANAACSLPTNDRWLLGAYYVLLASDYVSTHQVLEAGGVELNPLLGRHPSDARLGASALMFGTVATIGACTLGDTGRRRLLWTLILVEATLTHRNMKLTARLRF